jgi:hypothetical protein
MNRAIHNPHSFDSMPYLLPLRTARYGGATPVLETHLRRRLCGEWISGISCRISPPAGRGARRARLDQLLLNLGDGPYPAKRSVSFRGSGKTLEKSIKLLRGHIAIAEDFAHQTRTDCFPSMHGNDSDPAIRML